MLYDEITPAADAAFEALHEIRITLGLSHTEDQRRFTLTKDEMKQITDRVAFVERTLTRFKACMIDEMEQKNRLRKKLYDNKILPYNIETNSP